MAVRGEGDSIPAAPAAAPAAPVDEAAFLATLAPVLPQSLRRRRCVPPIRR